MTPSFAQLTAPVELPKDSVYVFTRAEVISMWNKVNVLKVKTHIGDSLISLQRQQLWDYAVIAGQKNEIVELQKKQIEAYKKNEVFYKQIIEDMKPSWLDNKWIWLVLGAGITFAIIN